MARDPIRKRLWKLTRSTRCQILPVAAILVLDLVSAGAVARAQPASFTDFPLVIYCEYAGSTSAYYFSRLADGSAIYLTPDRRAGMITIDGTAQRVGGERSGSCSDKTLKDLRESGQAFDLPR